MTFPRWMGVAALCAGLLSGASGCNNARMVRWDAASQVGVVAIPHNDNSWPDKNREHAEELMKQSCPHGYQIVGEEEVVVGQVTHTHVNTDRTGDPTLAALHIAPVQTRTNETTSTEDKKEWRITFRSNDAPAPIVTGPPVVVPTRAVVPIAPPPVSVVRPATPPGLPPEPEPAQ